MLKDSETILNSEELLFTVIGLGVRLKFDIKLMLLFRPESRDGGCMA